MGEFLLLPLDNQVQAGLGFGQFQLPASDQCGGAKFRLPDAGIGITKVIEQYHVDIMPHGEFNGIAGKANPGGDQNGFYLAGRDLLFLLIDFDLEAIFYFVKIAAKGVNDQLHDAPSAYWSLIK